MTDWVYEWLARLAVPGLAGIGGIVVGTGAMVAAYTSNKVARQSLALAQQVRDDEQEREDAAAEERYRAQLEHFIETAISSLVEYANAVEKHPVVVGGEQQLHAATQARLILVDAVAQGEDTLATKAAYEVFHELGHHRLYRVRRDVAGLLTGALAQALARQLPPSVLATAMRGFIKAEEDSRTPD